MLHSAAVLGDCSDDVDSGRVDTAVTKNVGELGEVLFEGVEGASEKVSEVVREDFAWVDSGGGAEVFHVAPNVCAVDGLASARNKNGSSADAVPACVGEEFLLEVADDNDGASFAFEGDDSFALGSGLDGDVGQLAHADAGTANGLDDEGKTASTGGAGGLNEAEILGFGQFLLLACKGAALHAKRPNLDVRHSGKIKKTVYRCEHRIDACLSKIRVEQVIFVGENSIACKAAPLQKSSKRSNITSILSDSVRRTLFVAKVVREGVDEFICYDDCFASSLSVHVVPHFE